MLRPLPDLNDDQKLATLGRLTAIRSAWFDALHQLRDSHTRLNGSHPDVAVEIAAAREALDRLETLDKLINPEEFIPG